MSNILLKFHEDSSKTVNNVLKKLDLVFFTRHNPYSNLARYYLDKFSGKGLWRLKQNVGLSDEQGFKEVWLSDLVSLYMT